ncbi:hypothetical protein COHCIP112018_05111 [Cohnella sp. JJ-181]|nr:hypothetical protein COHCIP112018_05111 [Cohnella sp. JJ-181]
MNNDRSVRCAWGYQRLRHEKFEPRRGDGRARSREIELKNRLPRNPVLVNLKIRIVIHERACLQRIGIANLRGLLRIGRPSVIAACGCADVQNARRGERLLGVIAAPAAVDRAHGKIIGRSVRKSRDGIAACRAADGVYRRRIVAAAARPFIDLVACCTTAGIPAQRHFAVSRFGLQARRSGGRRLRPILRSPNSRDAAAPNQVQRIAGYRERAAFAVRLIAAQAVVRRSPAGSVVHLYAGKHSGRTCVVLDPRHIQFVVIHGQAGNLRSDIGRKRQRPGPDIAPGAAVVAFDFEQRCVAVAPHGVEASVKSLNRNAGGRLRGVA